MALAIFLHVLAMTNSDLGLDAHVRLNAAMDGQHDGQDLAWGKLRIADSSEQAPTNEQVYDGYIAPWFESELAAKFTAFVGVLCVACLAGLSPRWASPSQPFNPMKPALILFSPVFVFVSARGYDEGVLAFVAGFGTVGFLFNQGEERAQRLLHVVMMAASVMLVLGWKGFSPIASIGAFLLTVAVGAGWLVVEEKSSGALGAWLVHPWKMASLCALLVFIGVMVVGFMADTGTFAIIGQHPVGFVFATTVALIHSLSCSFWSVLYFGLFSPCGGHRCPVCVDPAQPCWPRTSLFYWLESQRTSGRFGRWNLNYGGVLWSRPC